MRVLAGDVGGTNARLAGVEVDGGRARVLGARQYPSAEHAGLGEIVLRFLGETGERFDRACFGIAGPVVDGVCDTTNLHWVVRADTLAREIGIPRTTIINDFEAIGHALPLLGAEDVETLQTGEAAPRGVLSLIGAGTGLGQGFLVWDDGHYRVCASEGGHTTFAPRSEAEWGLAQQLARELTGGHVSYERIVSGPGLVNVYEYLAARAAESGQESPARADVAAEGAAAVSRHGLSGTDPVCVQALDIFTAAYGAQAGNLALTVMSAGGVFVAGGIASRILSKMRDGSFIRAFQDKGRLSPVLARMPVHVITNPNVGLVGSAAVAATL